jgi:hypothetical protein
MTPALKRCAQALCLALLTATGLPSAQAVEVLVLGTYHLGNPGLDAVNRKVDDVLTPRRQAELQDLTLALARFAPSKVMVERKGQASQGWRLPSYADWQAGKLRDKRNEVEQIGYRLAAHLNHNAVYGIDVDGTFPFEALQAYADKTGQGAALKSSLAALQAEAQAFEQMQDRMSIGALLAHGNQADRLLKDHQFYTGALRYGRDTEQPGVALLSQWITRNLHICARMVQLAEAQDRIVLLYGSGHSYLLRQCVLEQPGWRLVDPLTYLPPEKAIN